MIGVSSGVWTLLWMARLTAAATLPDGDLCRWMNGRKYYVEAGESGTVTLRNVTGGEGRGRPGLPRRCGAELVTCPSCHLIVTVLYLNVPACGADGSCGCDYLWIREPAYSRSGREFCGFFSDPTAQIYESKTKTVSVDFLYSYSYSDAFSLHFAARENLYRVTGSHLGGPSEAGGILSSPFFPASVPGDYAAEFVLNHREPDGFVQLLFVDFRLSSRSYIELYDTNGTKIDVYDGNVFRPPAVSSSGPTLGLKLRCNEERPSSGFKAEYSFVNYPDRYWSGKPVTDCGGLVDDFGGAVTLANAAEGKTRRLFDCVWLIRPRSGDRGDTRLAVRLAQFRDLGAESSLEIRRGLTSESPLLETVSGYRRRKNSRGREYVVPSSTGFYVRLRGSFGNASYLAITYVSFAYDDCYDAGDFECGNGRCIKHTLRCDGFNHCGDGTDEATCFGNNQGAFNVEEAGRWRTMTPNYYFPKPSVSDGTGTNTLVLATGLAGLGTFILTTVTVLVKLRRRQPDHSGREAVRTPAGEADRADVSENHDGRTSQPPRYDPPPSYEEAVKYRLPPPPAYDGLTANRPYPASPVRTERYARGPKENVRVSLPRVNAASGGQEKANARPPGKRTEKGKRKATRSDGDGSRTKTKIKAESAGPDASACDCGGACSCPRPKVERKKWTASVPFGKSLAELRECRVDVDKCGKDGDRSVFSLLQRDKARRGSWTETDSALSGDGRWTIPEVAKLRKVASQPDLRLSSGKRKRSE